MNITLVSKDQRAEALCLLQAASLPVNDIDVNMELFAAQIGNEVAGTIGWETNGETGLLRSLSVKETSRGKGCGEALVNFLEAHAKQKGLQSLYLLTTTAASFFSKKGYTIISRTEVPSFIQQTSEFRDLCPASATVMKKEL